MLKRFLFTSAALFAPSAFAGFPCDPVVEAQARAVVQNDPALSREVVKIATPPRTTGSPQLFEVILWKDVSCYKILTVALQEGSCSIKTINVTSDWRCR